jgi:hypothetical protein
MSIIDPRGFDDVRDWADIMTGQLGFFTDPVQGSDDNFERLDDPSKWQEWACGVFGGTDPLGQDVPDPNDYDDWKEWAMRMFSTTNFTG